MRTLPWLLGLAVLLAPVPRGRAGPVEDLLGRWEPAEQSTSGMGGVLWFHEDGTCAVGMAVLLRGTWRAEGDRLITTLGEDEGTERFRVEGVEVLLRPVDGAGGGRRMTRHGAAVPGAPPIVGVWSFTHYTGQTAWVRYTATGAYEFRIPIATLQTQPFRVAGDVLHLGGEEAADLRFTVDEKRLVLGSDTDAPDVYLRVEPVDWYPFEGVAQAVAERRQQVERVFLEFGLAGRVTLRSTVGAGVPPVEGDLPPADVAAWMAQALAKATTKAAADGYQQIPLVVAAAAGVSLEQVLPFLDRVSRPVPGLCRLELRRPGDETAEVLALTVEKRRVDATKPPPAEVPPTVVVRMARPPDAPDTLSVSVVGVEDSSVALPANDRGGDADAYEEAVARVMNAVGTAWKTGGRSPAARLRFERDPTRPEASWPYEIVWDLLHESVALGISHFDVDPTLPPLSVDEP